MKTAIYIEDGLTQLVLTPESDFEKGIVNKIEKRGQKVEIYTGEFYACMGGWIRQGESGKESLIIVMSIKGDDNG